MGLKNYSLLRLTEQKLANFPAHCGQTRLRASFEAHFREVEWGMTELKGFCENRLDGQASKNRLKDIERENIRIGNLLH